MNHQVTFSQSQRHQGASAAFSLVELLVIVSLIVVLIAILLPGLGTARETGRMAVCMSNLRQLGMGVLVFSNDHQYRLPGIWGNVWVGPEPWQGCWLSNPPAGQSAWDAAAHTGTIYPYVTKSNNIYRCPSLQPGIVNSGVGSNGKFDYSAWHAFAGARRTFVPRASIAVPYNETVGTPFISEESPYQYINRGHVEGGFGGGDRMGNWHNGSGNIVAIDGSAYTFRNALDLSTFNFIGQTPSGANVSLSSHWSGWGGWDKR